MDCRMFQYCLSDNCAGAEGGSPGVRLSRCSEDACRKDEEPLPQAESNPTLRHFVGDERAARAARPAAAAEAKRDRWGETEWERWWGDLGGAATSARPRPSKSLVISRLSTACPSSNSSIFLSSSSDGVFPSSIPDNNKTFKTN